MKGAAKIVLIVSLILTFALLGTATSQADGGTTGLKQLTPGIDLSSQSVSTYIIQLDNASLAAYRGGIEGLAATSPRVTGAAKLDVNSPESQAYLAYLAKKRSDFLQQASEKVGRELTPDRVFDVVYGGLTLQLSPEEAAQVASLPMVRRVQKNFMRQPLTDSGPKWIGAPSLWGSDAGCTAGGFCGEGIVIGVVDTGINDGHPSFADVGDDGYDHTNPLGSGTYKGWCNPSDANYDSNLQCNDKLIGMYDYVGDGNGPRDTEGHGSHTSSTAAGNFVDDVEIVAPTITFTTTISGVAPHANIIMYRACGEDGCPGDALTDAINQAVADGVDVINYSIGGASSDPWTDADAQAFLDAWDANVFVAASAGNSGPGAATLGSPADAPWLLGVGAATHNRAFLNSLIDMTTDQGTTLPDIEGRSITSGYGPAPIVYAGDHGNALCLAGVWGANEFNGEIVVCDRGQIARVDKSANAAAAGAGGMILANSAAEGDGIIADAHSIPSVHITYKDGVKLKNWIANGDTGHVATIAGTTMAREDRLGDHMASFSSRGPDPAAPGIVKPDIIGPGVDIIAAVADDGDASNGPDYDSYSGTSMSSPHLAGSGILLKQAHPTWSPDEIKSAIMTTSKDTGLVEADGATPTTPFSSGAGRVALANAKDAAMLLEETRANYDAAASDPTTLNLASFGNGACYGSCGWTRTVHNPTGQAMTWTGVFTGTNGLQGSLSTTTLNLPANGSASFSLNVDVTGLQGGQWYFGEVTWTENSGLAPNAHFPVAVKVIDSTNDRMIQKAADPTGANNGDTITYNVAISNTEPSDRSFTLNDPVPANATYVNGSETGGWTYDSGTNAFNWTGTLPAAQFVVEERNLSGYHSMADEGVGTFDPPSDLDTGCWVIGGMDFWYLGTHYDKITFGVNGAVRPGGSSLLCPPNSNDPMPTSNGIISDYDNLIAPFWTDLDFTNGGAWYAVGGVTYNGKSHTVFEWEDVPVKGSSYTATFQIWIEDGGDNIWFSYPTNGPVGDASATPNATIGAENEDGSEGVQYYYNGAGTMPDGSVDVWVGLKPEVKEFTYQATANANAGENIINEASVTVDSDTNTAKALTHVCDGNVTAADAAIDVAGDKFTQLDWSAWGDIYADYQLWRSATPYFTPGDANSTMIWEGKAFSAIDYDSDSAWKIPDTNYYYQLRTLDCTGAVSADDNQEGEFDFSLIPGSN